jgi:hypothetical protein
MTAALLRTQQRLLNCLQDHETSRSVCSSCDNTRLELLRLNRTLEEAKRQNLNHSGYRNLLQAVLTEIDGLRQQMEHRLQRRAQMNFGQAQMQTSSSTFTHTAMQFEATPSCMQNTKQNLVSIREAIQELRDDLSGTNTPPNPVDRQPSNSHITSRKQFRFDSSSSTCPLVGLLASSEIGRHLLDLSDADQILGRFEHMDLSLHDWQMLATDLIHAASAELSEAAASSTQGDAIWHQSCASTSLT